MLLVRKPDPAALAALVERAEGCEPTYAEIGATRGRSLPPGYRHDRYEGSLGRSVGAFAAGAEGLREWGAHRGAGVQVEPHQTPLRAGATVVLVLPVGLLYGIAPCRVIYVIEEDDRFGFAYGTLPGHPEQGEEAFIVRRDADHSVRFEITAFSHPVEALARLGGPLTRQVQQRVTRRYLTALADFVEARTGG